MLPHLDLMPGLPIKKAVTYVCWQPDGEYSLIIRRYTNCLMLNAYNRDLRIEKAQYHALKTMNAAILSNANVMSYILTGKKNDQLTPDQLTRKKSELVAEVINFNPKKTKAIES